MAGILSAVVGGLVTTLYRGGHISVNGPAKGVIGVILLGIALMDDGTGQAFNYVLAAVVVSGALQMLLGILKLGRLADIFHTSVIHGILAAKVLWGPLMSNTLCWLALMSIHITVGKGIVSHLSNGQNR